MRAGDYEDRSCFSFAVRTRRSHQTPISEVVEVPELYGGRQRIHLRLLARDGSVICSVMTIVRTPSAAPVTPGPGPLRALAHPN